MIEGDTDLKQHSVLIVDDEPDNLIFYDRILRPLCSVLQASGGVEAIEILKDVPISVVVTDQRMPGMTGIEMLALIQEFLPDVPKIVVTAYGNISPILMAVNSCSLFGYLVKPVKPGELEAIVRRALREYVTSCSLRKTIEQLGQENRRLRDGNEQLEVATAHMKSSQEELKETIQSLQHAYGNMVELAHRDVLTQVRNRRRFVQDLDVELQRYRRYERPASLLLVDIDRFKRINDNHGHPIGDTILQEVANELVKNVRTNDRVFRVGGDEFAVILPEADQVAAENVASKLSDSSKIPLPVDATGTVPVTVTISIGVQSLTSEISSTDEWYALADASLYRAKRRSVSSASV